MLSNDELTAIVEFLPESNVIEKQVLTGFKSFCDLHKFTGVWFSCYKDEEGELKIFCSALRAAAHPKDIEEKVFLNLLSPNIEGVLTMFGAGEEEKEGYFNFLKEMLFDKLEYQEDGKTRNTLIYYSKVKNCFFKSLDNGENLERCSLVEILDLKQVIKGVLNNLEE